MHTKDTGLMLYPKQTVAEAITPFLKFQIKTNSLDYKTNASGPIWLCFERQQVGKAVDERQDEHNGLHFSMKIATE